MKEALTYANEELKRVDHLIYVSLKYTRTVDVMRSVINRMINSYDFIIKALLLYMKRKKKLDELPTNPGMTSEKVKELFPDDMFIRENIDLYLSLRKIIRADYNKREEYRRHVTMISIVDRELVEINIDVLTEYFSQIKQFWQHARSIIEENES